jgi:hypothetical protein
MEVFFTKIIPIENKVDYRPGGSVLRKEDSMIMALHITKELSGDIVLINRLNEKLRYPAAAFVVGGIYNFPVIGIEYTNENDNKTIYGCLLGYKHASL